MPQEVVQAQAVGLTPTDDDKDRDNVIVRAMYLRGMSLRLPDGDDRRFVIKAAKSLIAYAETLG